MPEDRSELETQGRVWRRGALNEDVLAALDRACRTEHAPGVRLNWTDDLSEAVGGDSHLTALARQFLAGASPVRMVVFNKSGDVNWLVPWHQDRVIAVREKHDVAGFERWTRKSGVWHVEPPIEVLRGMIFARVHLDDTDEHNGCLELALGSHVHGRIDDNGAAAIARTAPREICRARRGDVLFVNALVLHRSEASRDNADRRTLRIDYSADGLPEPLHWAFGSWSPAGMNLENEETT